MFVFLPFQHVKLPVPNHLTHFSWIFYVVGQSMSTKLISAASNWVTFPSYLHNCFPFPFCVRKLYSNGNFFSHTSDADYGGSFSDVIQGVELALENLSSDQIIPSSFRYRTALEKQVSTWNEFHCTTFYLASLDWKYSFILNWLLTFLTLNCLIKLVVIICLNCVLTNATM